PPLDRIWRPRKEPWGSYSPCAVIAGGSPTVALVCAAAVDARHRCSNRPRYLWLSLSAPNCAKVSPSSSVRRSTMTLSAPYRCLTRASAASLRAAALSTIFGLAADARGGQKFRDRQQYNR